MPRMKSICHLNAGVSWTRTAARYHFYVNPVSYIPVRVYFSVLLLTFAPSTIQRTKNWILLVWYNENGIPYKWSTCSKCQLDQIYILDSYCYFRAKPQVWLMTNYYYFCISSQTKFNSISMSVGDQNVLKIFFFAQLNCVTRTDWRYGSFDVRNCESLNQNRALSSNHIISYFDGCVSWVLPHSASTVPIACHVPLNDVWIGRKQLRRCQSMRLPLTQRIDSTCGGRF